MEDNSIEYHIEKLKDAIRDLRKLKNGCKCGSENLIYKYLLLIGHLMLSNLLIVKYRLDSARLDHLIGTGSTDQVWKYEPKGLDICGLLNRHFFFN
jgi:hypothetical protein